MSNLITGSQNGRKFELRKPDGSDGEGPVWSLFLTDFNGRLKYASHDRPKAELHGIAIEFLWTGAHP